MKPSEILKENQNKEEHQLLKELIMSMKDAFVELIGTEGVEDKENIELKDLILKLNKLADKDEYDDEDLDFITSYMDEFEELEDIKTEDIQTEKAVFRRRDVSLKRKRHRDYLASRSKVRNRMKRFRMTGKYKRYKVKAKRMAKMGKTSKGKRVTKWINK